MTRKAARELYDVDIQIDGGADKLSCVATAFVKMTYRIDTRNQSLKPADAIPLEHNIRDETLVPRLPPHSDYWPWKTYTDVGVVGSAHAADGHEVTQLPVTVRVGRRRHEIVVVGERLIEFSGTKPRIGSAQPFTSQPLGMERAYGGCDFRVPFDPDDPRAMGVTLEADHPGLYPRNPWGTGYLVESEPIEGMPLPTQEDPNDLLTNEKLVMGNPEQWFQQPLPAHIGWVPVNCYPRCIFMAIECEPWFPAPDDRSLKEVQAGHLVEGYRKLLADHTFGSDPHWRFQQEAVPELMFKSDLHGAPVELAGLHPAHPTLQFALPTASPDLKMKIENTIETLPAKLTSVEIRPDQERVTMTYAASMKSPRPFIPGIHKKIPVAVSVNGEKAVPFDTPPTIKQRLADAEAEANSERETTS